MKRLQILALLLVSGIATAARAEENVDFNRDVRPILSDRCFKCHGPGTQEADVRLDRRESVLLHNVIVPGKPQISKVIRRTTSKDDDIRMPPAEEGERLTPAQVATLRTWIEQGAEWAPHWAYVAPAAESPPTVEDRTWPRNLIDPFILARLERAGLRPAPAAEKTTLVRRVYLDLLGLLPEPAAVDDFLDDTRPDAYDRLVDRLLASPHYGERQARHWLDLARYADSNGFTIDGPRSIWPYRDWVIRAFNEDMPFDRFTIEQLAGDLLPSPTRDQLVATGFHRNTPFNEEGGANPEQFRAERTVDRTNATGSIWLGLTVGCAQCHDHKYDAISHKEYYQLYAFFDSCDEPELSLPTPEQEGRLRALGKPGATAEGPPLPSIGETEALVNELRKEARGGWKILDPVQRKSDRGTTLGRLGDRSVLAGGNTPDTDTYTVRAEAPEGPITAVRLEALTHPSLPQKGPGRAGNGNFVLSKFTLEVDGRPVPFRRAVADHSQQGYDVAAALEGDPRKGWAISVAKGSRNVNRQAVFITEAPVRVNPGQSLTFVLTSSEWPKRYGLGRFRLAVTSASDRFLDLPIAAQQILLSDPDQLSSEDIESFRKLLARVVETPASERARAHQRELSELKKVIPTTLVLREADRPRATHIHERGDYLRSGERVQPETLACLPPLGVTGRRANRLDLARWLVRPDHPLTARVLVNRIWQQYFGSGLVQTESDFGMQGSIPTHPELLDRLAIELIDRGWSLKAMHRLIVTSATYRQASVARPELDQADPLVKLLGRQQRLRVEAEIIRDAALSASGLLTAALGGPGVYPPQPAEVFSFTQSRRTWTESPGPGRYRRGMYTFLWRQSQHPLLTTFDGPEAQTACTRRNRSDTPLQALHLANDAAFIELALGLGRRVVREGPADDAGRIDLAFRLCFARTPTPAERTALLGYLAEQKAENPDAAWTMVVRVLINLDEFVTRE